MRRFKRRTFFSRLSRLRSFLSLLLLLLLLLLSLLFLFLCFSLRFSRRRSSTLDGDEETERGRDCERRFLCFGLSLDRDLDDLLRAPRGDLDRECSRTREGDLRGERDLERLWGYRRRL